MNQDSDPEEADIEEHITRGPGGSIMISQTIRSSPVRRSTRTRPAPPSRRRSSNPYLRDQDAADRDDPERMVMRQFQGMFRGLLDDGPPPPRMGRHDYEDHFPRREDQWGPRFTPPLPDLGPNLARNRSGSNRGFTFSTHEGPNVFGSRVTYATGRLGARPIGGGAGEPPNNELTS